MKVFKNNTFTDTETELRLLNVSHELARYRTQRDAIWKEFPINEKYCCYVVETAGTVCTRRAGFGEAHYPLTAGKLRWERAT